MVPVAGKFSKFPPKVQIIKGIPFLGDFNIFSTRQTALDKTLIAPIENQPIIEQGGER
jgi:hypothetical protein